MRASQAYGVSHGETKELSRAVGWLRLFVGRGGERRGRGQIATIALRKINDKLGARRIGHEVNVNDMVPRKEFPSLASIA